MATLTQGLQRKLKRILAQHFPGARIQLERFKPLNKYGGFLIWRGFEALDQVERQGMLWKVLRANLDKEEQLKITAILTMTPAEKSR